MKITNITIKGINHLLNSKKLFTVDLDMTPIIANATWIGPIYW